MVTRCVQGSDGELRQRQAGSYAAAPSAPGPNQGCSCNCFLARHSHGKATRVCYRAFPPGSLSQAWQLLRALEHRTLKQVRFACLLRFSPFPSPGTSLATTKCYHS